MKSRRGQYFDVEILVEEATNFAGLKTVITYDNLFDVEFALSKEIVFVSPDPDKTLNLILPNRPVPFTSAGFPPATLMNRK